MFYGIDQNRADNIVIFARTEGKFFVQKLAEQMLQPSVWGLGCHSSTPLDDKDRLVVNTILLAFLPEVFIAFQCISQQGIADVFRL